MDAAKAYGETSIATQDRGRLIVMLYDGALKYLKTGKKKLQEEDYAGKGMYIGKAQDIISELSNSLEPEAAPDLADNLRALYNFLYHHLTMANIERDPEKIDECIEILDQLREAWDHVADKVAAGNVDAEQSGDGGFEV